MPRRHETDAPECPHRDVRSLPLSCRWERTRRTSLPARPAPRSCCPSIRRARCRRRIRRPREACPARRPEVANALARYRFRRWPRRSPTRCLRLARSGERILRLEERGPDRDLSIDLVPHRCIDRGAMSQDVRPRTPARPPARHSTAAGRRAESLSRRARRRWTAAPSVARTESVRYSSGCSQRRPRGASDSESTHTEAPGGGVD